MAQPRSPRPAVVWFLADQERGWAICPATESGFVRVSSNSNAIVNAVSPRAAISMLEQYRDLDRHEFWPTMCPSRRHPMSTGLVLSRTHRLPTAQLLALARSRGGSLATFDRRLTSLEAPGATSAIEHVSSVPK